MKLTKSKLKQIIKEEFSVIDEATTLATRLEFKVKIMPDEQSYQAKCRGEPAPCALNARQVKQLTKEFQLFLRGFEFDGFPKAASGTSETTTKKRHPSQVPGRNYIRIGMLPLESRSPGDNGDSGASNMLYYTRKYLL